MKYTLFLTLIMFGNICYSQYAFDISVIVPKELNQAQVSLGVPKDHQSEYLLHLTTHVNDGKFHFEGNFDRPCYEASLTIKLGAKRYQYNFVLDSGLNEMNLMPRAGLVRLKNNSLVISQSNLIKIALDSVADSKADSFRQLTQEHNNAVMTSQLEHLKHFPNNFYSLSKLYFLSLSNPSPKKDSIIISILDLYTKDIQNSPLGIKLRDERLASIHAARTSKIGSLAFEFEVLKPDGKMFSNRSLLGSPYIIAFSATWCQPCQKQLPVLLDIYKRYADKGLKVVYFNLDDNVAAWKNHIKKHNLTWINVSEGTKFRESKIARQFHIYSIPNYILVDKGGLIVYNSNQMDDNFEKLKDHIDGLLRNFPN